MDRDSFVEDATVIWEANARGEIEAFIAAITPINVFFITRKSRGLDAARRYGEQLLASLQVCPLNHQALLAAEILPLKDYEDAVQLACALFNNIDAIVTRDLGDFTNSSLPVYSPADFVTLLKLK